MRHQLIALSLGLMGAMLLASPAQGQRHGGPVFAPAGRAGATFSRGGAVGHRFFRMRSGGRAFARSGFGPNYYSYYPSGYYPYYYPFYDSDYYPYYDSQDEAGHAPPPPLRAQTALPAAPAIPPKPPESLVMELRGDHWVRLTSLGPMEIAGQSTEPESGPASGPAPAKGRVAYFRMPIPSQLPPAVLVFRDGHQEEVGKYTIIGTAISVKTDYWSSGSWTRNIPIADLDLAATLQLNQERGARFTLPSRPSEVIVR